MTVFTVIHATYTQLYEYAVIATLFKNSKDYGPGKVLFPEFMQCSFNLYCFCLKLWKGSSSVFAFVGYAQL